MPRLVLAAIAALLFAIVQGWLLQLGDVVEPWRRSVAAEADGSGGAIDRVAQGQPSR